MEEAESAWEDAHPFASDEVAKTSPLQLYWEGLRALEKTIFARPVNSWTDVAELGLIALYWSDKTWIESDGIIGASHFTLGRDPNLTEGDYAEQSAALLIQAVAKLALGGAHV